MTTVAATSGHPNSGHPDSSHPGRAPRQDLQADATVIGAGFAGLTAAALLTKRGYKVRVLERDIHPGGCATAYTRKTAHGTFRFPVGATVAAGLEPGGLFHQIYAMLGMTPQFTPLDPAMRLHLPDRKVFLRGTRAAWDAELEHSFPGQIAQKRAFWREVQETADVMHHVARKFPVMPFKSIQDVLDTARGFHPGLFKVLLGLNKTVKDALDKHGVSDPAHKAFIDAQLLDSMQCVSDECALPNGSYALEIYRYGAQYVPGGLASIADNLAGSIESNGSTIHYATRARRIVTEKGRVVGVESHGRMFRSPVVISTAPVTDTLGLLGEAKPALLEAHAARQPEIWGAFTLYMGVRQTALPADVGCFEQIVDFDSHGLRENFLVSISPSWDRLRAPEGFRSVTISTHVHAKEWFGLPEDAYHDKKLEHEKRILERLEALWPGFNANLVHLESGSPRTFERFTLHGMGRVGGIPQTPKSANFNAQHHRTGIQGLLLAGETIFPGQGTIGVAVSGYNASRTATRYLSRTHSATTRRTPRSVALGTEESQQVA
jgi:C-3',4' desaturase CrtD